MNDAAEGNGENPFTELRLERLGDAVYDESERLDKLFNGRDIASLKARLDGLLSDMHAIDAFCGGDIRQELEIRKLGDSNNDVIDVKAKAYRFRFARPAEHATWYDFVYLREL